MVHVGDLEARFKELFRKLGAHGDSGDIFYAIATKYSEPQRHYHNIDHISECLQLLDQHRDCATNLILIETAIWFHDIIYDTHRSDNEEKSAEYTAETLRMLGVDVESIEKIRSLVIATKHNQAPENKDTALLLDIDLAILGKPEQEFNKYEKQIREEYKWVPLKDYVNGRTKILERFLSRNQIFYTKCFKEKFEAQARKNLKESIKRLGLL